jgi:pimeloyl-ACP methyl ester carboxylesterase
MSAWDTSPSHSGLVSIGRHQLFASVRGPIRPAYGHQPIVLIFAGAGESSSSWSRVQEGIAEFARVLVYDRSGLGRSEERPASTTSSFESADADAEANAAAGDATTATIAAVELRMLLRKAGIAGGPYVLLGHSYGGIVAREFLHLVQTDEQENDDDDDEAVAGMVLAEGSTERQHRFFRIPDPNILGVMGDLKWSEVTRLKALAQMSRHEWRVRAIEMAQGARTVQAEAAAFVGVCQTLAEKDQCRNRALQDRPLSVIKCRSSLDYERIYRAGIEAGYGTDEQRRAFRNLLDRWDSICDDLQREQLKLSSQSRLIEVPDCGHNVNLLRPDVVVQEVRWVVERAMEQRTQGRL